MKFLNRKLSKKLLLEKSLPLSLLNDNVLVVIDEMVRIVTKDISKIDLEGLNIKSAGLPIARLANGNGLH